LVRSPALLILVIVGTVHVIRGAPVDAVIFLGVAAALALAELRQPPLAEPTTAPPHRVGRTEALAVLAGALLFGIVVGSWIPFSTPVETAVIAAGVLAIPAVWRQPAATAPNEPPIGHGALAWMALGLSWCVWELVSFIHEINVNDVSVNHPTFSDMTEPALTHPVVRWIALTAWISAGYAMVRTARQTVRR
ncbi:MAG TPA: hypothetical protein VH352_09800, partial [Pseudonocardiaceae bacterium]|nr:hypothetical protein [Pseudonocardiaceae bacterium]